MRSGALWAAPVSPERWFASDRIAASRAYHGPLSVAAVLRAAGRIGALALVFVLAGGVEESSGGGVGGLGSVFVVGAATGVVLAVVNAATDAWMEYRHEPTFGSVPMPVRHFARLIVGSVLIAMVVSAVAAAGLHVTARSTPWWPVVVVAVLVSVSAAAGPATARFLHRFDPLDPVTRGELDLVADAVGVRNVQWGQLSSPSIPSKVDAGEAGLNAITLGFGRGGTILLTKELLGADPLLRDFVVAHEASHLRRRHHQWSFAAAAIGAAVEVGCLWLLARSLWQESGIEVGAAAAWPLVVAAIGIVSLPVGAAEAWLSRAHERQADADAAAAIGPVGAGVLRALHDHDRSDLCPGLLARCWSAHPSPAERLAAAERIARASW